MQGHLDRQGDYVKYKVSAVVNSPVCTREGEIISTQGYDLATGLYLAFGGLEALDVPAHRRPMRLSRRGAREICAPRSAANCFGWVSCRR